MTPERMAAVVAKLREYVQLRFIPNKAGLAAFVFAAAALEALTALADAADAYAALQASATNLRIGNVQPITVAEGNALNAALNEARAALALAVTLADALGVKEDA